MIKLVPFTPLVDQRRPNDFSQPVKDASMELAQLLIRESAGGFVVMGTAEGHEGPGGMVVAAIRFRTVAAAQAFNAYASQVALIEKGQQ